MKATSSPKPVILLLLSLSSVLLVAGFLLARWPFEIPGAVVGRLWLSNVYQPVLRGLSSSGTSFSYAFRTSFTWWPFVLGTGLLLPVLAVIGSSDRPVRKWSFLIGLVLSLGGLSAVNVSYATSPSAPLLVLGIGLGLGAGVSLVVIGRSVAEDCRISISRQLARTIRVLLISAGIGIGSFVLLPIGSIAFALALAAIAVAYAQAGLASRTVDRLSSAGRRATPG